MAVDHRPESEAGEQAPPVAAGTGEHEATIEAEGVTRAYGSVRALDGLDLRLGAGEVARAARPERRGQDDGHPRPDDDPRADRRPLRRGRHPAHAARRDPPRIGVLPESAGYPELRPAASSCATTRACTAGRAPSAAATAADCSRRSAWPIARARRSLATAAGCASGWGSPAPWSTIRPSSSSTSRRSASIRPAGARCCAWWPASRASGGATVLLSTHVLERGRATSATARADPRPRSHRRRGHRGRDRAPRRRPPPAPPPRRRPSSAPRRRRAGGASPASPTVEPGDAAREWLAVVLERPGNGRLERRRRRRGRALARTGIVPQAFELEGARLSDAFLALDSRPR